MRVDSNSISSRCFLQLTRRVWSFLFNCAHKQYIWTKCACASVSLGLLGSWKWSFVFVCWLEFFHIFFFLRGLTNFYFFYFFQISVVLQKNRKMLCFIHKINHMHRCSAFSEALLCSGKDYFLNHTGFVFVFFFCLQAFISRCVHIVCARAWTRCYEVDGTRG